MTCANCVYLEGIPGRQMCGQSGNPIYGDNHKYHVCSLWHDKRHPQGAVWPVQAKRVAPAPVLDSQGQEITVAHLFPD